MVDIKSLGLNAINRHIEIHGSLNLNTKSYLSPHIGVSWTYLKHAVFHVLDSCRRVSPTSTRLYSIDTLCQLLLAVVSVQVDLVVRTVTELLDSYSDIILSNVKIL